MHSLKHKLSIVFLLTALLGSSLAVVLPSDSAYAASKSKDSYSLSYEDGDHVCGSGKDAIKMSIGIGCKGDNCHKNATFCGGDNSAAMDATFAIIKFLSNGAGLILVGSLVYAGIQYSLTRGDPQAVAAAQMRIRSVVGSLLLFIFAYALLNYLIPGTLLK